MHFKNDTDLYRIIGANVLDVDIIEFFKEGAA